GLEYENRVLRLTMSGELELLENTTRFYGFSIATDGAVELAYASLISEPLVLIDNVLTLDELTIEDRKLQALSSVTLEEPFGAGGPHQVRFAIAADGTIEGGANIVLLNETPALDGDDTEIALGELVTADLRYLSLNLDFNDVLNESAVLAVADFYVQNHPDKRIELGTTDGHTLDSWSLRIGFDGSVAFGNARLADPFEFDFEVVKLR